MNFSEIQAEIANLEAMARERYDDFSVRVEFSFHSGRCHVYIFVDGYEVFPGHTPREVLDKARAFITALPDAETLKKQEFQTDLAGVIDQGHDLNLPADVMDPLRAGSQAMTENLLTHKDQSNDRG